MNTKTQSKTIKKNTKSTDYQSFNQNTNVYRPLLILFLLIYRQEAIKLQNRDKEAKKLENTFASVEYKENKKLEYTYGC